LCNYTQEFIDSVVSFDTMKGFTLCFELNSLKSTVLLFLISVAANAQAQIVVGDYPKEIQCNINDLKNVAAVAASSDAGPVISNVTEQIFSGGCMGTLVRSYRFTNKFGEEATAEQFIFLSDTDAPVLIGVPADLQVIYRHRLW
jgi:hypothetical protein